MPQGTGCIQWERRKLNGRLCDWCRLEIPYGWFRLWAEEKTPLGTYVCDGCRNGKRRKQQ